MFAEGSERQRVVSDIKTGKIYKVTLPEMIMYSETFSTGVNQELLINEY